MKNEKKKGKNKIRGIKNDDDDGDEGKRLKNLLKLQENGVLVS